MLEAIVAYARGAVALAEGDAASGARRVCATRSAVWLELDAPYEVARTRVLVAQACSALGDDEAAALELEAAREHLRAARSRARSRARLETRPAARAARAVARASSRCCGSSRRARATARSPRRS